MEENQEAKSIEPIDGGYHFSAGEGTQSIHIYFDRALTIKPVVQLCKALSLLLKDEPDVEALTVTIARKYK